jgi:hypothetical protein
MLSDLDELRRASVPRPLPLCRRLSRRIDSVIGFVAYGMLWFFFACAIATVALLGAIAVVGSPPSDAGKTFVWVAWSGAFVGAWVLFGAWVRWRSSPARRLFRDGVFIEATVQVVHHLHMRSAPFTRATLRFLDGRHERTAELSIGGHPAQIVEGATLTVLFVRDYRYCAVFPIAGRAVPASVAARGHAG